jgi:Ca2+-binding EF-hand superfamily protein
MQAYRQKQMAARLKAIDTNGDGKISRAEADAKAPRLASHFDKLDTNKDGFLSREELAAHAAHQGERK